MERLLRPSSSPKLARIWHWSKLWLEQKGDSGMWERDNYNSNNELIYGGIAKYLFPSFSLFSPPAGKLSTGQVEAATAKNKRLSNHAIPPSEIDGEAKWWNRRQDKIVAQLCWLYCILRDLTVSVASEHLQSLPFSFFLSFFLFFQQEPRQD